MEIIRHPETADEVMVWFWQRYVTGEGRIAYRASFRNEIGQFARKPVKAELPQTRQTRVIPVHDFLQGDYTIKL